METIRTKMLVVFVSVALSAMAQARAGEETTLSRTYEYDDQGRLVAERGVNGQVARYDYDADGRLVATSDALNRSTSIQYDELGRRKKVIDATNVPSLYGYDAGDRLTSVTDAKGNATTYDVDGFGQAWRQVSPDTGVATAEYTAGGLVARTTRNDGVATTYGHDAFGRVVEAVSGSVERRYTYDTCAGGKGRLCSAEQRENGVVRNTASQFYTAQGWLSQRRDNGVDEAGQAYDSVIAYAYDNLGRVTGVSYPSGLAVGYGYVGSELSTMTAVIDGTTRTVASNVAYEPFGPTTGFTYGNGLERLFHRDLDGRVFGVSAGTSSMLVQSLTYGFNAANEIVAITNGMDATQTRNYQYDVLGRVEKETVRGSEWSYDANGNRTRSLEDGLVTTYSVATGSNRLLAYTNNSVHDFGYDANGNRTSELAPGLNAAYSYDAFNRLRGVIINGAASSYTYNALDQRVGKSNAAGITRYIYTGQNQLLAERGGGGWTSYLWLGNQLIGLVKPDQELRFVHGDHLGRPEVVTDTMRQIVWRAKNETWTRMTAQDAIGGLDIGFPGQQLDGESGLWHNGYRSYDSKSGYLQPDPLGLRGGSFSLYGYASSNPVSRVDPSGLADLFAGGEVDVVGLMGFEVSGGLVWDFDTPLDSGIWVNYSDAAGANVGAGVMVGWVANDIEGEGGTLDFNAGEFSGTFITDDKGLQGGAISIGPGAGLSVSYGKTRTLSIGDVLRYLGFGKPPYKNPPQVNVGDKETVCVGTECPPEPPAPDTPPPTPPATGGGGGGGGGGRGGRGGNGGGGGTLIGSGCYGNCKSKGPGHVDVGPTVPVKTQQE